MSAHVSPNTLRDAVSWVRLPHPVLGMLLHGGTSKSRNKANMYSYGEACDPEHVHGNIVIGHTLGLEFFISCDISMTAFLVF